MDEELIMMLKKEIRAELGGVSSLCIGSAEESAAIENIIALYRLVIEDSKAIMEYNKEIDDDQFRREQMENEERFRKKQIAEQRIDRYVKIAIVTAEIAFYCYWIGKGFVFEETGSYASKTFKGLINSFKLTKK